MPSQKSSHLKPRIHTAGLSISSLASTRRHWACQAWCPYSGIGHIKPSVHPASRSLSTRQNWFYRKQLPISNFHLTWQHMAIPSSYATQVLGPQRTRSNCKTHVPSLACATSSLVTVQCNEANDSIWSSHRHMQLKSCVHKGHEAPISLTSSDCREHLKSHVRTAA